jgi:CheY-like chemotaxis protein
MKELDGHTTRVLVVDPAGEAASAVTESLSRTDRYDVRTAANEFEAGLVAGSFRPHVIFVDVVSESIDAPQILRNLRANPDLAAACVVGLAGALTRGQREALLGKGFDQVLCRPYAVEDLLVAVEEAMNLVS